MLVQYENIKYFDISHLFWKKYPYKVVIAIEPRYDWRKDAYVDYLNERVNFVDRIQEPSLCVEYTRRHSTDSINFFFLTKEDAENFISVNLAYISEVHCPRHEEEINILRDHKVRLRKSLFWQKYRWVMLFQYSTSDDVICSWLDEYFPKYDEERFYYSMTDFKRLYFRDELDIFSAKLALGEYVNSIEKAVLHEEVKI